MLAAANFEVLKIRGAMSLGVDQVKEDFVDDVFLVDVRDGHCLVILKCIFAIKNDAFHVAQICRCHLDLYMNSNNKSVKNHSIKMQ